MRRPLDILLHELEALPRFRKFISMARSSRDLEVNGAVGSLRSLLAAGLFNELQTPILWLFESQDGAMRAKEDLNHLLPVRQSEFFPESRKSRLGHDDLIVVTQQADILRRMGQDKPFILLASHRAVYSEIRAPEEMKNKAIQVTVNKEIEFDKLLHDLAEIGFDRQPIVESPGEFARRGGIVDVFAFTARNPVRIEFWGNRVESIREFDASSQRSTHSVDEITIAPRPCAAGPHAATILDFIPAETVTFVDDLPAFLRMYSGEHIASCLDFRMLEFLGCDNGDYWQAFIEKFSPYRKIYFSAIPTNTSPVNLNFAGRHQPPFDGDLKRLARSLTGEGNGAAGKNYFLCESPGHAKRMRELLEDRGLDESVVRVIDASLAKGFSLPDAGINVFTDHEFYGRIRRQKVKRRFHGGLTMRQLKSISYGDYVVHADHGIGIFRGLEKIKIRDSERECLLLEYRDGDKLFVPLDRMDRVQKYTGRDGILPVVHKLGTPDWERLKKKTRSKVRNIAKELLQLYALRKTQKGHAFSPDTTWQKELEASFVHEDTPDQERAAEEVKRDMEEEAPMDRLICGDVGYGKTEVAVRATFKAVQDGKQVAVLVPTTILAEQHYLTFRERMARFPVRVEMLSRFRTAAEQKNIVSRLKSGEVDVVIGTHRLLSKDIVFKNLGLLIIDEEQRFGVRHKEKLKQLRVNVDVLAMSATPIPRTMQMSLFGVRDMSQINTPPRDRLPVQTEAMQFDPELIREAILREMGRGGQVFFVHNRVESIYQQARKLMEIVPEAEFAVAHGQLKERDLEKVMHDFLNQHYHVLVTTMIIESGLDMPNVNTIFINRADRFGLSQLYQLRGRVGRSSQKAYCYLIIPAMKSLTPEAIKRLETIEQFTDLGSGMQIALRDLEIRGAGNLLGAEQSGFIESMGIETYLKILEEAVRELRAETDARDEESVLPDECKIEAGGDAILPEAYIDLAAERVDIYRRIAHAQEAGQVKDILEEVRDRFGRPPREAVNLFNITLARILGRLAGFKRISVRQRNVVGYFSEKLYNGNRENFHTWLKSLMQRTARPLEFFQDKGFGVKFTAQAQADPLEDLVLFLHELNGEAMQKKPGEGAGLKRELAEGAQ